MTDVQYIKVENNPGLVRDPQTGAILNNNTAEIEAYNRKRLSSAYMKTQIEKHSKELDDIKEDISQIKSMIIQLLDRK